MLTQASGFEGRMNSLIFMKLSIYLQALVCLVAGEDFLWTGRVDIALYQ